MKIYDDIPYFDGHNDVLLKLLYSKNKIKINDFIEGNENYHIDIPKINKANFIGGFFAIFSPNEKPTEEFFSRMKASTYNYELPEPLLYPHALSATISMISILNDIQKKLINKILICKNSNDIKNVGLSENLEQSITLIEWPELIINKPENRFDLFFKYAEDYNERSLIIKTNGRLKNHEF